MSSIESLNHESQRRALMPNGLLGKISTEKFQRIFYFCKHLRDEAQGSTVKARQSNEKFLLGLSIIYVIFQFHPFMITKNELLH